MTTTLNLEVPTQNENGRNMIIMKIEELKWDFVELKLHSRSGNLNSKCIRIENRLVFCDKS